MLDYDALAELCQQSGCQIYPHEPMSAHTTFRVGGPCLAFVSVPDAESCLLLRQYLLANAVPHRIIGRGSNLLVPDAGYEGVVLSFDASMARAVSVQPDGTCVCAAGVPLKQLCLTAQRACMSGLEFAYGIPGTVGGALYMNAGAYDGCFSQLVTAAEVLDGQQILQVLPASAMQFSYRHSVFMENDFVILQAVLQLTPGDPNAIRAKMEDYLARRQAKQPLEYPSAGSTFKRPANGYASQLIDQCGLKGYRMGDAQVSDKHAGFIVNRGNATCQEILSLCAYVQAVVLERTGITLELEPELLTTAARKRS